MSNIIKSEDTLVILNDIIDYISKNEITKDYLEKVLSLLLPKENDTLLIDYNVIENGFKTAMFVPKDKSIFLFVNNINIWLDKNINDFKNDIKTTDINSLRPYFFLLIITHEIEHSYQYLMGNGLVDAPNDILKDAYKGLNDLLEPNNYIIPRPIKQTRKILSLFLYRMKQNFYLLERNANIESMDLVSKCALSNNRDDIYQLFNDMKNTYMKCGYTNSTMGSIEETYRQLLMYDKYKKFYEKIEMSEEDRVRYGFNITEETREKILKKQIK